MAKMIQISVTRRCDRACAPVVAFDGLGEFVDGPLFADAAEHGLQLVLVEALQRSQRKHLCEARPAIHRI